MAPARSLRIAVLHPDLGLGGAERLVVDAAMELQSLGHRLTLFVGGHDPARAFPETVDGRLNVRVHGGFLPLSLGGRLRAPLTIARMMLGALAIRRATEPFDAVFCDVASHVIPLLRGGEPQTPVIFYCHFPDRLLTPPRHGLYALYRVPFDSLEERGLARAARVLVNSRYTANVFASAYPGLRVQPAVVYPGVDTDAWSPRPGVPPRATLVSVARFERSKNVALAVMAFARLRDLLPASSFASLRLLLAGGFDERLRECKATLDELRRLAATHGIQEQIDFLPSCPEAELRAHVANSLCMVYTPPQEHFGYAPVEAMACARPVVAVSSGGPLETVVDGETGFLVPPTADAFAAAIGRLVTDPELADRMGNAGRERAVREFSRRVFGAKIEGAILEAVGRNGGERSAGC